MNKNYQILGILLVNRQGEFSFVPVNLKSNVKKKEESVSEIDTGIEESLNAIEYKEENTKIKPTGVDQIIKKYAKAKEN